MTSLPIGKNHHPRPGPPNNLCNFEPIFPGVFDASVRNIKRLAPGDLQDLCCFQGFSFAIRSAPTRAHLAAGQIQNARAMAEFRHLEKGSAAGLFNIVAMRGDREDIEGGRGHYRVRSYPGPRKARPGRSSVILLSSTTGLPFTRTSFTPTE